MKNELLEAALFFLHQGLPIFPVSWDAEHKNRKKPLVEWKQYQSTLPTEDQVIEWWTRWPDAGIGVATGKLSGIVVVDAEKGADFNLFGLDGIETPTVKTGGGGRHWWFQYYDAKNATRFADLYDFKGEGGYIILPPSVHDSGNQYEWIIPFGSIELAPFPKRVATALKTQNFTSTSKVEMLLSSITKEGSRNDSATSIAGSLLLRYKPTEWQGKAWPLFWAWNIEHNRPPLDKLELETIWQSIQKTELERRSKEDGGVIVHRGISEPTIEELDDEIRITVATPDGEIIFAFSEVESKRADDLVTVLKTQFRVPGGTIIPFSARLNILSLSNRTQYTRGLTTSFGKSVFWDLLLSRAIETFKKHRASRDDSSWFEDTNESASSWLFPPFVIADAPNMLFGRGGSGKTYLALRLALAYASGKPFLNTITLKTGKTLFIDYEANASTIKNRILNLAGDTRTSFDIDDINQKIRYWSPHGVPLHDCLPAVIQIIKKYDISFVIVDSAALACGGEPEKAETAIRYFNALATLKTTSLTIAHETKNEAHEYPFGSIFWTTAPRNMWNIQVDSEAEERVIHAGLIHRKSNDGKKHGVIAVRLFFGDGFVDIGYDNKERWEHEMGTSQRILKMLATNSLTFDQIATSLEGVKRGVISSRLNELKRRGSVAVENSVWYQVVPTK